MSQSNRETNVRSLWVPTMFFYATQPNPTRPNDKSARFRLSERKKYFLKKTKKREPNIAAHCTLLNGEELQVRHGDRLDPK